MPGTFFKEMAVRNAVRNVPRYLGIFVFASWATDWMRCCASRSQLEEKKKNEEKEKKKGWIIRRV